jgi:hypothetical protein
MKLTTEQVDHIRGVINQSNISIDTLRDDLLDHLCCVVEINMTKGEDFEIAFEKALHDFAPDGLEEIQHQTLFLLNSTKIIIMKKLMYTIGFIGAIALTAGVLFTLLRLPGSNQLFMVGYLTLFLIFIPLSAIDRYKVALAKASTERTQIILGVVSAVIGGLAGLFKLMHLQGADLLLLTGALVFALGFLPFFFFTMYKKSVA